MLQVNLGHFIKILTTTKTVRLVALAQGTCWVILEWMFCYYSSYCKFYPSSASPNRENISGCAYETVFFSQCRNRNVAQKERKKVWNENPFDQRLKDKNPAPPSRYSDVTYTDLNVIFEETASTLSTYRMQNCSLIWNKEQFLLRLLVVKLKYEQSWKCAVSVGFFFVCFVVVFFHFWVTNIKVSNSNKSNVPTCTQIYSPQLKLVHFLCYMWCILALQHQVHNWYRNIVAQTYKLFTPSWASARFTTTQATFKSSHSFLFYSHTFTVHRTSMHVSISTLEYHLKMYFSNSIYDARPRTTY